MVQQKLPQPELTDSAEDVESVRCCSRLPRLHVLSWIVLFLSIGAMVLIILPGAPGQSTEQVQTVWLPAHAQWIDLPRPEYRTISVWRHGWPFEYLRKPFVQSHYYLQPNYYPLAWSSRAAWYSSGEVYFFSPWILALDVVAGISLVILFVTACELWRRRRPRLGLKLLDACVLATLICCALGWFKIHEYRWKEEQSSVADLKNLQVPRLSRQESYHGPDWLRRLVGNPLFLQCCNHVETLNLPVSVLTPDIIPTLERLVYVRKVNYEGNLTEEAVRVLAHLKDLRQLSRSGGAFGSEEPWVQPEIHLATLNRLQSLPRLNCLNLSYEHLQPQDLKALAEIPRLEILEFRGNTLLIEDLAPLEVAPHLKEIHLRITATKKELIEYQSSHPNLKVFWPDSAETEPLTVAQLKIARWRGETPHTLMYKLRWPRNHIDLSGVLLTKERLDLLPQDLKETDGIAFGKCESPKLAIELLCRCGRLGYIDLRHVELHPTHLSKLDLTMLVGSELHLQHGSLSDQQLSSLVSKLKPSLLSLFNSSLTENEARKIERLVSHEILDVYSGFTEKLEDRIYLDPNAEVSEVFRFESDTSVFE